MDFLVFTDLDGTLLDHDSYSYDEALPAIDRLSRHSCPVIFNSSKTASEISQLREELHNNHPFIVENGSAVYSPDSYFKRTDVSAQAPKEQLTVQSFGPDYHELLTTLHALRAEYGYAFRGFSDFSIDEVADLTGLSSNAAAQAKERAASEPLVWQGDENTLIKFKDSLEARGLSLTRGGRFYHVMGQTDKASALLWLAEKYRQAWPNRDWRTVALGDGPNDRAMLEAADIAVVIKTVTGEQLELNRTERVICPEDPGPRGWRVAIDKILQQPANKGV